MAEMQVLWIIQAPLSAGTGGARSQMIEGASLSFGPSVVAYAGRLIDEAVAVRHLEEARRS
jgi:hypothetical protein